MRNRRFRPMVDGLDRRLLLSDVTTGVPGSGMQGLPPGSMPGDEVDPTLIDNSDPDDPMNPPIPPVEDPTSGDDSSDVDPQTTTSSPVPVPLSNS